jgi:hypothetical protein
MRLIELVLNPDPPLEEMANLFKTETGLDYPLWVGKVGGQHGPRVKVSNIRGKMSMNNNFVVSVDPNPEVITPQTCNIDQNDVDKVKKWISINYDDLMTLWWMFEHGAIEVKDVDTGKIIKYDDILYGFKKV